MTAPALQSSPGKSFRSALLGQGGFNLILILIALLAAIPRFWLGRSQFIEYDGYWHIFIARQDSWHNFWTEIRLNAHPPLYFLILKLVVHFGHSLLVYRSISLLTGIVSVVQVGWITRKVTRSAIWALVTALAYGLALPGIIISCEVRSYMLSAFFILISVSFLLDMLVRDNGQREILLRTGYAVAAILACLSHYYAFFYAGASVAFLIAVAAVRSYRKEPVNWAAEAATVVPVFGTVALLYEKHVRFHAHIQAHLLPYYYNPAARETLSGFLLRNWKNFVNLFSPYPIESGTAAVVVLLIAVTGGALLLRSLFRRRDAAGLRAGWLVLLTATLLAAIVLAGVAGKYPFGGDLRQQFLLFPFLAICAGITADRLSVLMPARLVPVAAVAVVLWVVLISAIRFQQYPKVSENVLQDRMRAFDQFDPNPAAVYVDQYNLITFFIYHHDWSWSFVTPGPHVSGIDLYRLRRGNQQMFVFRDLNEWNAQPDDTVVFDRIAACLHSRIVQELAVFSVHQSPPFAPFSHLRALRNTVLMRAAEHGLCVQGLAMDPFDWYAEFRISGCTTPELKPPRLTGLFDDTSPDIDYGGSWRNGTYPAASGGTETFSNHAGSTAELTFQGTEITWIYAKAFNRGIADVVIDGRPRGSIDLYSPGIAWQSRTIFGNLAPGRHTFRLSVTGRKDSAASDSYVDIDALVAR